MTNETTGNSTQTPPEYLPVLPEGIPDELRRRDQWVIWKRALRDGCFTKVPLIAIPNDIERLGAEASVVDPTARATFDQAVDAYNSRGPSSIRGVGFVFTLEAGIVRVADALDMAKGRSRIPFEAGQVNIHSVSAAAVDAVEIGSGELKPVRVSITLTNAAGLFQIDELLKEKLRGSGLEPYVEVVAHIYGEADKRLFQTFSM